MARLKYWRKMWSKRASPALKAHARRMYSRYGGKSSTHKFVTLRKKGHLQ